jgi:hypothetical protein
MRPIIGLLKSEAIVDSTIVRIKEAGLSGERISIISNPKTINSLLGCGQACVIKDYTGLGAAIGIGIYAIFGLAAALCECNVMHYGQEYGAVVFIGSLLAGTLVGAIIGVLVGAGEAEKDTHFYVQGIRLGGRVLCIEVDDEDAERVKHILAMENVRGVKAL